MIEGEYLKSGNRLGWRLLMSPESVMSRADVAFIGLNPGGSSEPTDHPRFAPTYGSAYVVESWAGSPPGESRLQRQVRALFDAIGVEPSAVLAGNLIPFRSPNFAELGNAAQAMAFGRKIWRRIFDVAKPGLVIGMGGDVERALVDILKARDVRHVGLNWGSVKGRYYRHEAGRLVILPHLSRFGVVTREVSQDGMSELFGDWWHP